MLVASAHLQMWRVLLGLSPGRGTTTALRYAPGVPAASRVRDDGYGLFVPSMSPGSAGGFRVRSHLSRFPAYATPSCPHGGDELRRSTRPTEYGTGRTAVPRRVVLGSEGRHTQLLVGRHSRQ